MTDTQCVNWDTEWNRCRGIREKCDGYRPTSGRVCRFKKTPEQKAASDARSAARLEKLRYLGINYSYETDAEEENE